MADAQRSLADLLTTLFQDGQGPGAITPQDVRNLIVSIGQTPHGSIYTDAAAETTIVTQGVYVKAAGTTQIADVRGMDSPADNRLRHLGNIPYHTHIVCPVSMTAAGDGKLAAFKLYHWDDSLGTGAVVDGSQVNQYILTGANEESIVLNWDVLLDTNDYLELHIANLTDTTNITVSKMYLAVSGIPE